MRSCNLIHYLYSFVCYYVVLLRALRPVFILPFANWSIITTVKSKYWKKIKIFFFCSSNAWFFIVICKYDHFYTSQFTLCKNQPVQLITISYIFNVQYMAKKTVSQFTQEKMSTHLFLSRCQLFFC